MPHPCMRACVNRYAGGCLSHAAANSLLPHDCSTQCIQVKPFFCCNLTRALIICMFEMN